MKNQILLTVLVAGGAGLAGAVLGQLLLAPNPNTRSVEGDARRPTVEPSGLMEMNRRIDELASENVALWDRVASLESRPAGGTRVAIAPESIPAVTALHDELQKLAASLDESGTPPPANFTNLVSDALGEIRASEEAERDRQRLEAVQEATEERLQKLAGELGLSNYQVDEMRPVLIESQLQRREAMEAARAQGDFRSARQTMRDLRDETNERLALILTPDQLEQYDDLRDDGNPFRRGAGRNRGQTDGGGGGGNGDGGGNGGGGRRGGRN